MEDVDSFDEDAVVLFTQAGTLSIKGTDLHINKLSVETGEVSVEGEITSLSYTDDERGSHGTGFLAKLFK